jgi:hypothetical protein
MGEITTWGEGHVNDTTYNLRRVHKEVDLRKESLKQ